MQRSRALTSRDYWDRTHDPSRPAAADQRKPWWRVPLRRWLGRGFRSHADLVRTHVLERHLPRQGRIIEIGCAPGRVLLTFRKRFGLEPFGVEYSPVGHQATLAEFERQRVDSSGILLDDFTDPEFRRRHGERFDVVFSDGLIEHFTNPAAAVAHHVELLKPGGQLVVGIPNLRGALYHPVLSLTCRDVLAAHNLDVMRLPAFRMLFAHQPLDAHYCDYLGTVSLPFMIRPRPRTPVLDYAQAVLDVLLTHALRHRDLHNRFTSPYLLYVGTRHGPSKS